MNKIASFCINHDVLQEGMYVSRIDGDVTTYDLRFVRPNTPPFMDVAAMHTIEHLVATYVRNSEWSDHIIYFGPMGCRTGFYLLTRDLPHETVIALVQRALAFTAAFEGDIPGASAPECGNWREHDLDGARALCAAQSRVMEGYSVERLTYPQ